MATRVTIHGKEGYVSRKSRLQLGRHAGSLSKTVKFGLFLTFIPLLILLIAGLSYDFSIVFSGIGAGLLFLSTFGSIYLIPIFNMSPAPSDPYIHSTKGELRRKIRNLLTGYSVVLSFILIPISMQDDQDTLAAYVIGLSVFCLILCVHVYELIYYHNKLNKFGTSSISLISGALLKGEETIFNFKNDNLYNEELNVDLVLRNIVEEWHPVQLNENENPVKRLVSFIRFEERQLLEIQDSNTPFKINLPNTINFPTKYNYISCDYWEIEVSNIKAGFQAQFYLDILD